jgi:tRNA (cytidine/uridine-2'-O-)-methyltransferase
MGEKLNLILFNPEIPQNTGNIGRLCAYTQCRLHLIHPLGFTITDRHLKRSGMDYWKSLDLHEHANWEAFQGSAVYPNRIWMFTTRSSQSFWDVKFAAGDGLLFGNEGHGCPDWLHAAIPAEQKVTLPQFSTGLRSLNLSTAAGIGTYEALRQIHCGKLG